MGKLKVLLTGAAGMIGQQVLKPLQEAFELRTFDRRPVPGDPQALIGRLEDRASLRPALKGIEVVIHLAANPHGGAAIEDLIGPNVLGLDYLFQECRAARVRRVVFASTCQTVLNYPQDRMVEVTDPVRPCSVYGASKVFGEALGRFYHDCHGLEFVGLRIGGFAEYPPRPSKTNWGLNALWLSPPDAAQVLRLAAERPGVKFLIAFATSRCDPEYLSLKPAREGLGYEPHDDVRQHYPR